MNSKRFYASSILAVVVILAAGLAARSTASLTMAQGARSQAPVGTPFTYQGRLTDAGGNPVNDACDLQFSLWDDPDTGSQVGSTLEKTGVAVGDGLLTVQLDFGSVFDGTALWLEVAVRCTGDPGYLTLPQRQPLTPAPYALHADLLDGQHGAFYQDASNLIAGELAADRFSAYTDLVAEGYLNDDDGADLATRAQADGRFVNEGQADSITSAMIVDGELAAADLQDGTALAEILDDDGAGSGLDADLLDGLDSGSLARVGRYFIPGGGGSVAIPVPHYNAFQVTIGEAYATPTKVGWMAGIENDGDLAWIRIDSTGAVATGTCDLGTTTTILTLGANITLRCPGNGNLELTLVSSTEDVRAFLVW